MSKVLKWILGILLVLVVVAALAGIGYMVFNRYHGGVWMMGPRAFEPREGQRLFPWRGMPMHPFVFGRGFRAIGFFPLGMLGWLVCPGLLALIAIGLIVYFVGPRSTKVASVTTLPPATPIEAAAPAPTKACPNCGQPVNEEWKHCPHCGAPLT